MNHTHVTPNGINSEASTMASSRLEAQPPLVIAAADPNQVMREQLEYLIEHAGGGTCGCSQCERYLRARALMMEIFAE